jgi:FKBP-type peptidyl-prolyl cis-trans isomerase
MQVSRLGSMLLVATLVVAAAVVAGCSKTDETPTDWAPPAPKSETLPPEQPESAPAESETESAAAESAAEEGAESTTEVSEGDEAAEGETITTDSGLQYIIQKKGDGAEAVPGKKVLVHYTGTLKDTGEKFDSSLDRGTPIDFVLGAGMVIPGWDEGIAGMKVGERRKLIIPSKLGYGASGSPPVIPPNADLVFETELVDVK